MVSLYRYRLPFRTPFKTEKGTFKERSGLLISSGHDSLSALSEASPLPGFSGESQKETEQYLISLSSDLDNFLQRPFSHLELKQYLDPLTLTPSAEFALSTLGASILLQRNRSKLNELFPQKFRRKVKVNAVTGLGKPDEIISGVKAHYENGFRTIKMKSPADPEPLISTLKILKGNFPDISFRIDANQSWPSERAQSYIEMFEGLNVEYIEEPVSVKSVSNYQYLVNHSPIPIALDESLTSIDALKNAFQTLRKGVFIIKPMLLGNIFRICETISENRGPLQKVVVTTALESAVGRCMVNSIAALAGDPDLAHGLNTGVFFKKDLYSLPAPSHGSLYLNAPFDCVQLPDLDQNLIQKIL
jgi:o-succinylbenzoate synthase